MKVHRIYIEKVDDIYMFFKKRTNEKINIIKSTYLNLLNNYTTIKTSLNTLERDVKKETVGVFLDRYECKMFSHIKHHYALRFNDDMSAKEFEDVFNVLIKDFGNPDKFSEYEGYIWYLDGYIMTYGLVALNHCYEVPMIYIFDKLSLVFPKISFEEFNNVAVTFKNSLLKRGIDVQELHFYRIAYFCQYGYCVIIRKHKKMIFIEYKKATLSITINTDNRNLTPNQPNKVFNKEIKNVSISKLEEMLETLLVETEEQHKLLKNKEL